MGGGVQKRAASARSKGKSSRKQNSSVQKTRNGNLKGGYSIKFKQICKLYRYSEKPG
jgi:hypothetical protein